MKSVRDNYDIRGIFTEHCTGLCCKDIPIWVCIYVQSLLFFQQLYGKMKHSVLIFYKESTSRLFVVNVTWINLYRKITVFSGVRTFVVCQIGTPEMYGKNP